MTFEGTNIPPSKVNKMAQDTNNLSPKQLRFCMEYMKDHNATHACIRAGYSKNGASVQGCRLLALPKVKALIQKSTNKIAEQSGITADKVVKEMAAVGMIRLSDVVSWTEQGVLTLKASDDLTPEEAAAISEVTQVETLDVRTGDITTTTKLRLHPKVTALAKLAEWLGIGPDQLPPSVQVNIQALDGSKVAVQVNEVVKDYAEALEQAMGIVKDIPPKKVTNEETADDDSEHDPDDNMDDSPGTT